MIMELYYHKTSGGAEYYSTTFVECRDGHKEGTFDGVILRVDGGEIEVFTEQLKRQGLKLVMN